ncbi:hypothetical protein FIBSPDRAFT_723294 [Athelia psychrophila]|uniref:Uncharacterized protein n=1 Tax=Athelia psychrophila TaxID=1759441 RepID=A0A166UZS6_9AGAM|nr:hypothetical protein FIBSPDRAFT_723294 [Fibularhizoctonia sp. CBS 109695]
MSSAAESSSSSVAVHRCRFIDYTPSPITALAFPPFPLPSSGSSKHTNGKTKFGTLAVGRANGNIELCEWTGSDKQAQGPQAWVVRKTLTGPYPSKVDSLAFTLRFPSDVADVPSISDLRLFSSGGGSELLEWDLVRGCVRRTISSQAGAIWSLAPNPASTVLALGCEDGSVRLLSLADDTLEYLRRFDRVKCRVLSIAWGPPVHTPPQPKPSSASSDTSDDEDEDEWKDEWLVTGGSDSALRKWDVATGRVMDRMGTDRMRGERTLVWAVGVLGDGTIVSGDSMGTVKFWDAQTCTQMQSFTAHGADVLCLAISPEGKTVYTSGVDQKIVQFTHVKTTTSAASASILQPANSSKWVQSCTRRMHSHDVRALAIWPPYTPLPATSHKSARYPWRADIAPVLASGGLDMSVVLTPAATSTALALGQKIVNPLVTSVVPAFEDAYHRRVAYPLGAGGAGVLGVAREARMVSAVRDTGVGIWRVLPKRVEGEEANVEEEEAGWEKVLDIELNAHTNLIASAISNDGRWLAVSDFYETRLFALDVDKTAALKPRRIRALTRALQGALPPGASTGGATFGFTPDSGKMVVGTAVGGYVLLVDLSEEEPRVLRRWDHHRTALGGRVTRGPQRAEQDDGAEGGAMEVDEHIGIANKGAVETSVSRLAISADGQWLATTDTCARTHIFNLDSVQHHAALPSFSLPAQALAFEPTSSNLLVLAFPDNTFQVFDVEAGVFPEWARTLSTSLPKRFTRIHDPVLGIAFDPASQGKVLFWGSTWMCRVNLGEHMSKGSKKRRRNSMKNGAPEEEANNDFKMVTHYRPILHVEFLAPGELVVVERPLVDVLATLPPAYFKPKYGAS